jgi:hypothetical protein
MAKESGRKIPKPRGRLMYANASLACCPLRSKGGCRSARHGTYERLSPPRDPYCPQGHRTFSLLPDCPAARLPGALAEVEGVVGVVEWAKSLRVSEAL